MLTDEYKGRIEDELKESKKESLSVYVRFRPINKHEADEWRQGTLLRLLTDASLGDFYSKFKNNKKFKNPKKWHQYIEDTRKNREELKKIGMQPGHMKLFRKFLREFSVDQLDSENLDEVIPFKVFQEENQIQVLNPKTGGESNFSYDDVLWWDVNQAEAFKRVALSTVLNAINGINGTIFAYGQSGTGKTYSLVGPEPLSLAKTSQFGFLPMSIHYLFTHLQEEADIVKHSVNVSFLEIYLEQLKDLIEPGDKRGKKKLTILEMTEGKYRLFLAEREGDHKAAKKLRSNAAKKNLQEEVILVQNLSEHRVRSASDFVKLLKRANDNREHHETNLNKSSSRSHMICTVHVTVSQRAGGKTSAKIHVVDLAGSEKISKTGSKNQRLKEAKSINASLTALRNVIDCLAKGKKHVPFRDSKLSMILKDSLGGNTKTTLLINVSPHKWNFEETMHSLMFGTRAKFIENKVKPNIHHDERELLGKIEKQEKEIARLTKLVEVSSIEIEKLQEQLKLNPTTSDLWMGSAPHVSTRDRKISSNSTRCSILPVLRASVMKMPSTDPYQIVSSFVHESSLRFSDSYDESEWKPSRDVAMKLNSEHYAEKAKMTKELEKISVECEGLRLERDLLEDKLRDVEQLASDAYEASLSLQAEKEKLLTELQRTPTSSIEKLKRKVAHQEIKIQNLEMEKDEMREQTDDLNSQIKVLRKQLNLSTERETKLLQNQLSLRLGKEAMGFDGLEGYVSKLYMEERDRRVKARSRVNSSMGDKKRRSLSNIERLSTKTGLSTKSVKNLALQPKYKSRSFKILTVWAMVLVFMLERESLGVKKTLTLSKFYNFFQELKDAERKYIPQLFGLLDDNKNGFIHEDEVLKFFTEIRQIDALKRGSNPREIQNLSLDELVELLEVSYITSQQDFETMDRDKDGQISREDIREFLRLKGGRFWWKAGSNFSSYGESVILARAHGVNVRTGLETLSQEEFARYQAEHDFAKTAIEILDEFLRHLRMEENRWPLFQHIIPSWRTLFRNFSGDDENLNRKGAQLVLSRLRSTREEPNARVSESDPALAFLVGLNAEMMRTLLEVCPVNIWQRLLDPNFERIPLDFDAIKMKTAEEFVMRELHMHNDPQIIIESESIADSLADKRIPLLDNDQHLLTAQVPGNRALLSIETSQGAKSARNQLRLKPKPKTLPNGEERAKITRIPSSELKPVRGQHFVRIKDY